MRGSRTGHALALLVSATLLASLTVAIFAAPASARPTCQGQSATIVGTNAGEVIIGTGKKDVIVARGGNDVVRGGGGNDVICGNKGHDKLVGGPGGDLLVGQTGRDKLSGGPGRDRLLGGPDDDSLNGGTGDDACLQGTGSGPWVNCERPIPEPPTLVIAYSDVNINQVFDSGDVVIAKIVDTDKSGTVTMGDTIKTAKYPTSPASVAPAVVREAFEDFRMTAHTIASVNVSPADEVSVTTTTGGTHVWTRKGAGVFDEYKESGPGPLTDIQDDTTAAAVDTVDTNVGSPSQPKSTLKLSGPGVGDDGFIDVIFYPST
jgi:RTX calcium-binding nonapeptide repeat (4 copies)